MCSRLGLGVPEAPVPRLNSRRPGRVEEEGKSERGALDGKAAASAGACYGGEDCVEGNAAGIILPPEPTSMDDDLRYMHTEEEVR